MNLAVRAKAFKELTGLVQKGVLTFLVEGLTTKAIEAKWPEQFEEARLVWIATAEIGQNRSFTGPIPKVRFPIRKRTIEPISAAYDDLFVGYAALRSRSGSRWWVRISPPNEPNKTFDC